MIYLRFTTGTGPIARLIRWRTRGPWSHVSVLVSELDHYKEYEAQRWHGVRSFTPHSGGRLVQVSAVPTRKVRKFLDGELGSGYDWGAAVSIALSGYVGREHPDRWHCAELALAAIRAGGCDPLPENPAFSVHPNRLYRSLTR